MATEYLSTIQTGSNGEIRFEIHTSAHLPAGRQVSMRMWTPLSGLGEKVPTGRAIFVDAHRFDEFQKAVLNAGQILATLPTSHE